MNEILDAIKQSEFSFMRSDSEVPFLPVAWAQDRFYPEARFEEEHGALPSAEVVENTINLGLVLPAYVARRDMVFLGADLAWDDLNVRSGPYQNQSVLRLTPVAAWMHQFGATETLGVFAAPIFSKELRGDEPWGTSGYGGVIGMHQFSQKFHFLYGGVYQSSFGRHSAYPYLGARWLPSPKWSLDLLFPWPTISYVPYERWLLQVGVEPGGSSWVKRGAGYETAESLDSWNLTAGAAYRVHGHLWLYAGAGVAGLRGVKIESHDDETRFESKPGAVLTLALQFRP
jgi:hypothetical protein